MEFKYKFAYGNFFNFFFSHLIQAVYNAFTLLVTLIPLGFLYGWSEYAFRDNLLLSKITNYIFISIFVIIAACLVSTHLIPKKVKVINDLVSIKRYFLNYSYFTRGFNDAILIRDIIECKKYDGKRYLLDRTGPYAVFFFNWDNLVEIKTNDDKKYLVPIINAESFIEEINKRKGIAEND